MSENTNYGPLSQLIGQWKGEKGIDLAPEPNGQEENPYYETIDYVAAGNVENAESQVLSIVRYHQVVKKKSDNDTFHDQIGFWMWDENTNVIMHSLTIPRAVCVLAGGIYRNETTDSGEVILEVSAAVDDKEWGILQSPFMKKNAKTTSFAQRITVGNGKMTYKQTTMLDIYGRVFEHTDENQLKL
jgi:hypothetical protein